MAATIINLPHEITVDILSRLPIQYLSPLRYVNKTWFKLLTTDHHFAKLHFDRLIQSNCNPSILVNRWNKSYKKPLDFHLAIEYNSCDKAIKLEPSFDEGVNCDSSSVHGVCHGLVCLSNNEKVIIWNPVTNVDISILYSPVKTHSSKANIRTRFAFGYHGDIDAYKVIKIVEEKSSGSQTLTHVSVYTLGIDSSWRTLEEDRAWFFSTSDSPLVNGVLHWLNTGSGRMFDGVVALDLKKESFQVILLPHDVKFNGPIFCPGIKEFGGLLCFYCENLHEGLQIWAMKEYGVVSSWTKQFKVVKPGVSECFFGITPLGILAHNGEYVIEDGSTELILYDSKSNLASKLKGFVFKFTDAHSYIGSIISPRVINGGHET